ncbi:MAG: hypothetical protein NTW86_08720 [Candidatus Sumerlaeota bacterium]|nr:hypothetical protein [Candidatus Sumerlaeota bacterium]
MKQPSLAIPLLLGAVWLASPAAAQMKVEETPDAITVSSSEAPTYKIKLDLKQGGVATELCLPADGPNLIYDKGGFSGMFNLFACDVLAKPPEGAKDGAVAKMLIKNMGTLESAKVVKKAPEEVVVEIKGTATGWRLLGPKGEKIADYRQTFTFAPRSVVCDGEMTWVYGHDSKPVDVSFYNYFAPDTVNWPVRIGNGKEANQDLQLISGGGAAFPEGIHNPATFEVWFRNGQRMFMRSIEVPESMRVAPWFKYEKPWQTAWTQNLGFGGNGTDGAPLFPVGKPIAYKYKVEFPAEAPANTPPSVRITDPKRGGKPDAEDSDVWSGLTVKLGEEIRITAKGEDKEDGAIPGASLKWECCRNNKIPVASGSGESFTVKPTDEGFHWVKVSAKDSKGLSGEDYITFRVLASGATAIPKEF